MMERSEVADFGTVKDQLKVLPGMFRALPVRPSTIGCGLCGIEEDRVPISLPCPPPAPTISPVGPEVVLTIAEELK